MLITKMLAHRTGENKKVGEESRALVGAGAALGRDEVRTLSRLANAARSTKWNPDSF
jgi:hypothetical protein